MIEPGTDPDVVGGAVEQPVGGAPRDPEVEEELQEDVAAGAGAHLAGAGRDERAGKTVGEEPPVAR